MSCIGDASVYPDFELSDGTVERQERDRLDEDGRVDIARRTRVEAVIAFTTKRRSRADAFNRLATPVLSRAVSDDQNADRLTKRPGGAAGG